MSRYHLARLSARLASPRLKVFLTVSHLRSPSTAFASSLPSMVVATQVSDIMSSVVLGKISKNTTLSNRSLHVCRQIVVQNQFRIRKSSNCIREGSRTKKPPLRTPLGSDSIRMINYGYRPAIVRLGTETRSIPPISISRSRPTTLLVNAH